jgi:peptide/nickel transport system substrate-binding protein
MKTLSKNLMSRREFLRLTTVASVSAALAACAPAATATTAPQPTQPPAPTSAPTAPPAATAVPATKAPAATAVPAAKYKEAPALADLVKAGKLPAVDQRLPDNPIVIKPVDSVGKYGGTMRSVLLGGGDLAHLTRTIFYNNLIIWNPEWTKPIPNVAESWEVSPDGKIYTFKIRKGLKWSDGHLFTTEDMSFWWELFTDDSINPAKDAFFTLGGKMAEFTKVDDLTFKFTFAAPNGLFLQRLCHPECANMTNFAKHAVSKYYPKYNPDADKLAKDKGFDTAIKYMLALWTNSGVKVLAPSEFPTLTSHYLTGPYGASSTVVTAERNPYYFAVDTEGNQLPYVDKWVYPISASADAVLLKATNGEIDLLARHINTLPNKSVLTDNQKKGNYSLFPMISASTNSFCMMFNCTNKDEMKRKIFNDLNFRSGVSYAINRQEVIDTVYVGQGTPMQVCVPKDKTYYNEQLAKQYTEYSIDKANAALDKAGLDKRDSEKFRLGPDGKRFVATIETLNTNKEWSDVLELIKKYWEKVGLKTELKLLERTLYETHLNNNDCDIMVYMLDGGYGQDIKMNPFKWFPYNYSFGSMGWVWYYLGDTRGKDWTPPENVMKSITIYRTMMQTVDPAKQDDLAKQMLQQAADNFYMLGIASPIDDYGIVTNRVQNVPKDGRFPLAFNWPTPAPIPLSQVWIKE